MRAIALTEELLRSAASRSHDAGQANQGIPDEDVLTFATEQEAADRSQELTAKATLTIRIERSQISCRLGSLTLIQVLGFHQLDSVNSS